MPEEKYEELIEAFFNNELSEREESLLFALLGTDENVKKYFKQSAFLKAGINSAVEEFPPELDEKILSRVTTKQKRTHKVFNSKFVNALAYGLAVAAVIASLFFYSLAAEYRSELKTVSQTLEYQNATMQLIMNSFPSVKVTGSLPNEVIINKKL